MLVYIYAADIYCEQCGEAIRERIIREGFAPADPDDERSYDSDEFPKGPYCDGGGERGIAAGGVCRWRHLPMPTGHRIHSCRYDTTQRELTP